MKINLSKVKRSKLYLIIVILTFVIYGNSINNEYSLDDTLVTDRLEKIEGGIKTIPNIFKTHHAVDGEQRYGYRPIVVATFAIEKQFFSKLPASQSLDQKKKRDRLTQANISHFVNVLLYALTGIVLLNFLFLLFKDYNELLPILITFIFIIHPLHTEPVSNIKSRDELLVFLTILLTLISWLKYSFTSNYKYLFYGGVFFLVAILSKKSAIFLLGIAPVVLYFSKTDFKKILFCLAAIFGCLVLVKLMKGGLITDASIRNVQYFENPLLYEGSFMDRITVGLYCSWFYLKMLVFPKDMSYYYGFNAIPIADWSFYQVWLALIFYVPLGVYGVWKFIKREVVGLGILLWLGVMLGFLNILKPLVGIVADRFTYIFSLGFCIVLTYVLMKIFRIDSYVNKSTVNLSKPFVAATLVITIMYSGRVIARNPDWHDYLTTYYNDLDVVGESAKAHSIIANTLYDKVKTNPNNPKNRSYIDEVVKHYERAIEIDSTFKSCYNNLGTVYLNVILNNQKGVYYCKKALALDSNYLLANLNLAVGYQRLNEPDSAMKYYVGAFNIDPEFIDTHMKFNDFLSNSNQVDKGIKYLKSIIDKAENPKNIYMNVANLYLLDRSKISFSLEYYVKAFEIDQTDRVLCNHLVNIYSQLGNQERANYYTEISKSI